VSFLSADSLVCKGEFASLNIEHTPGYLIEIFPEDAKWVITNPSFPLDFGPLNTDTTFYVRIRDNQLSCDSIFQWNIHVDDPPPIALDTSWICRGDSVFLAGTWFNSEETIDENIPRVGCDSIHRSVIRFYSQPIVEIKPNDPCKGATGSIEVKIVNGKPPFTYSINGGMPQSNPLFDNLTEGTYLISILDGNSCGLDSVITLTEGSGVGNWDVRLVQPSCELQNGKAIFEAEASDIQFSLNGSPFSRDTLYENLSAGSYEIVALHPLGCLDTLDFILSQTGKPHFDEILSSPSHCGQSDGSITISSIYGGVTPFEYKLSNFQYDTIRNFDGLIAGSYLLSVIDSLLCENDTSITLNAISAPTIESIEISPALCGLPEGSINIITNPFSGLHFQINGNPPFTLSNFTSLLPGIYEIIVSDSFDCKTIAQAVVPDSFSFEIQKIEIQSAQCQKDNGQILVSTIGGPV
ncbi:MAG TPA: hypothetical protein VN763_03670, partial [Saprospiraceae bacterium]|nr:hypothetical protein [Saprospiraceae bacterium]